jgi:hypothetical protein
LLKQKSSIAVYRLLTKKDKLSFSVSVFSKQTEVVVFRLRNSRNMEMEMWRIMTWRWRHGDTETWRHGDMETWRHGDMETWRHEDLETWRHGDL